MTGTNRVGTGLVLRHAGGRDPLAETHPSYVLIEFPWTHMHLIKRALDPKGLLNPGKVLRQDPD